MPRPASKMTPDEISSELDALRAQAKTDAEVDEITLLRSELSKSREEAARLLGIIGKCGQAIEAAIKYMGPAIPPDNSNYQSPWGRATNNLIELLKEARSALKKVE